MEPTRDLRGIVTVLNTPFTAKDDLDLDSVRRHVEYAVGAGVHGFLVPALAAEVTKLTQDERLTLLTTVVKAVAGRCPVIAGVYAPDCDSRARLAAEYTEIGASGVLVSIPFETEEDFSRQIADVAAVGMPFLMIQDWSPNDYGIPISVFERLAEQVPSFKSVKIEVASSGMKYTEVLRRTAGRLHVAGGWAVGQMIEGLDRGVHAFMPTALHEIYVEIYRRYTAGDREGARSLHFELLPVLSFTNQHLDVSVHFFKRLLHRQGVYSTPRVREPIATFDEYHRRQAEYLLEYSVQLIDSLR